MKARTNDFKEAIKGLKEISSKITYTINGVATELGNEELNSVQPHYQGSLLKSIMKELDLDSNVDIPKETIINYQFGVKVNNTYEYINYGNYIVYSSEKQEDTNSYLIKCYDKMLYSMVDYEKLKYRNLFDKDTENYKKGYYLNSSGVETSGANWGVYYIPVKPNTSYTISGCQTNGGVQFCWFNSNKTFISAIGQKQNRTNITSPSNAGYIGLSIVWNTTSSAYDGTTFMLQEGSVATEYEPFGNIQYPISIIKYIDLLCFNIGLVFKNKNDYFTNYDKTIENELYLDSNGNSLGYKFRDVLDELAQVTGSIICINEDDDELEIRYPSDAGAIRTSVSGKNLTLANVDDIKVDDIELTGETTQASTPTPSSPQEVVNVTGRQEIKAVGKNLADISKIAIGKSWSGVTSTQRATILWLPIKANQKYNFVSSWTNLSITNIRVVLNHGSSDQINNLVVSSFPFTNTTWEYASIEILANTTFTSAMLDGVKIMLCKGEDSEYEPYKEQVNEINLGKNLFDKDDNTMILNSVYVNTSTGKIQSASNSTCVYIKCKSNTTYTISKTAGTRFVVGSTNETPTLNLILNKYTSNANASYITFKTGANDTYLVAWIWSGGTDTTITSSQMLASVQIEKGSQATSYSPYFTPIELCKIGTYQDKIFKTTGKNLFSSEMELGIINGSGENEASNNAIRTKDYISIQPNTTYYLSNSNNYQNNAYYYDSNYNYVRYSEITGQFTTPSGVAYLRIRTSAGSVQNNLNTLYQLELGNQKTEYEPYSNNEWYVKKAIGKVVLNGSESWNIYNNVFYLENIPTLLISGITTKSNYFNGSNNAGNTTEAYNNGNNTICSSKSTYNRIYIRYDSYTTTSAFQTWLGTHNTIVYYVLSTPTYEKLNDTLQSQLSNILLIEGLNNVTSSVPINLNYVSDIDTIDEEYFNEDNVNFGEVYGPVNTIILSRSAESDELAKSTPNIINDEDKIAIKISDNQILNFDDREEYLSGLLNRLSGTTYVQNDYSSKGICYYNIGDRYKAYIFGKYYRCLMLNDDVTIESGLSENVSTEIPETAETDYSKTSTSDKTIRRANLIVDKQLGEISGEVEDLKTSINGDNGLATRMTKAESRLKSTEATLTFIEENTLNEDGSVKAVSTSTNYKFDADGMKIGKSTDDFNSLQDNTGTFYYEKDTMTGKYTKDGGVFKDLGLYGKYYYGIDAENFDVATFTRDDALFLAQLYVDNNNETGFGHFFNR